MSFSLSRIVPILVAGSGALSLWTACGQPQRPTQQAQSTAPLAQSSPRVAPASSSAPPPVASAAPLPSLAETSAAPKPPPPPPPAGSCEQPEVQIRLPGAGALVVNNATTLEDAENDDTPFKDTKGIIRRTEQILDTLREAERRFRCCIDPWWKTHQDQSLRVLLRVEIDGKGKATSATTVAKRSTAGAEVVSPCLIAVAEQIAYPASPMGKVSIFELPIQTAPQAK